MDVDATYHDALRGWRLHLPSIDDDTNTPGDFMIFLGSQHSTFRLIQSIWACDAGQLVLRR